MPTGILDSFQIVVALYLFYIAFKGSGQMYRFGDMDEETQQQIRTPLRLLYAAGGLKHAFKSCLKECGMEPYPKKVQTKPPQRKEASHER